MSFAALAARPKEEKQPLKSVQLEGQVVGVLGGFAGMPGREEERVCGRQHPGAAAVLQLEPPPAAAAATCRCSKLRATAARMTRQPW